METKVLKSRQNFIFDLHIYAEPTKESTTNVVNHRHELRFWYFSPPEEIHICLPVVLQVILKRMLVFCLGCLWPQQISGCNLSSICKTLHNPVKSRERLPSHNSHSLFGERDHSCLLSCLRAHCQQQLPLAYYESSEERCLLNSLRP